MSRIRFAPLALGCLLALACVEALALRAARADAPGQQQIEEGLTCQCGCGLTVHSCNHLQCGSAIPLKQEVAQQIASGATEDQIMQYFARKYGEKILSAPGTSGFNLAAWIVPYVGIALGGVLIGLVVARWRRGSPSAPEPAPHAPGGGPAPADAALRARLERELADYERRS